MPHAPLLIWTNFLGRTPIREAAAQLGYTQCAGDFLWAKLTTKPAAGTGAGAGAGGAAGELDAADADGDGDGVADAASDLIGTAGRDLDLRVYECALVLYHRDAQLPPYRTVDGGAPRVWTVTTAYTEPATVAAAAAAAAATRAGGSGSGAGAGAGAYVWHAHPNHKPRAVLEPLLRTYTRAGDIVLDPFAGSGSVGCAALALGRRVQQFDRDPLWADVVARRTAALLERIDANRSLS